MGFFLSLFRAGVLPVINPFAPFPDIFSALEAKIESTKRDRASPIDFVERERERETMKI
jgi:hypothetical protein